MKNRIMFVSVVMILGLVIFFSIGLGTAKADGTVTATSDDNAGWMVDSGNGIYIPANSGSGILLPVTGNGFLIPVTGSEVTNPPVAEKTIIIFTFIPKELVQPAAPVDQILLSSGIKTSGGATICFPFRGGQFGWIGQIRQLVDTTWVPLVTFTTWVPTTEGRLMACTVAPAAGTYALFGYWEPVK